MKQKRQIYESIRKPVAPPTRMFTDKHESKKKAINIIFNCSCPEDIFENQTRVYNSRCTNCGEEVEYEYE